MQILTIPFCQTITHMTTQNGQHVVTEGSSYLTISKNLIAYLIVTVPSSTWLESQCI